MTKSDGKDIPKEDTLDQKSRLLLLGSVFVVASSGLVYELIAGAISSYLMGDAVTQFSLVIGVFLSAMGVGSYLTKFITKDLLHWFVSLELWIALIGGTSSLMMFSVGAFFEDIFSLVFYLICFLIGTLVGAEIPLLIRILKEKDGITEALSNVLALDYIGALVGSILFPIFILPWIGISRASVVFGLLNLFVAWIGIGLIETKFRTKLFRRSLVVGITLLSLFVYSNRMVLFLEDIMYQDAIVYAEDTPYQRIIMTRWRDDLRMYLNGHIQFSSIDEVRYHESLVHPAVTSVLGPIKNVLVLGGGDGLAVRELLKYQSIETIDLVDIDPAITKIAKERSDLVALNQGSLLSPKVNIFHQDAMMYLQDTNQVYDVILIDLPDPNSEPLCKLYSTAFYSLVLRKLAMGGIFVTQSSSPFYAPLVFWSIEKTIRITGAEQSIPQKLHVYPYHVNVPSFGEWGFILASRRNIETKKLQLDVDTHFLDTQRLHALFVLGKDMTPPEVDVNRLHHPILFQYYRQSWLNFHN